MKLQWKEQNEYYGLNHSTALSVFGDYKFDIRYDYDGDNKVNPKCGLWLGVYFKGQHHIYTQMGKSVDNLKNAAQYWLDYELSEYKKKHFLELVEKGETKSPEEIRQKARAFLLKISPDGSYGVRADLEKNKLAKQVIEIMARFADGVSTQFPSPREVDLDKMEKEFNHETYDVKNLKGLEGTGYVFQWLRTHLQQYTKTK